MVHVVEANIDAIFTTLSCSHIYKSIGSHVPICCSHISMFSHIVLMLHQIIPMFTYEIAQNITFSYFKTLRSPEMLNILFSS